LVATAMRSSSWVATAGSPIEANRWASVFNEGSLSGSESAWGSERAS
jgi:hypothetical protein